MEILEIIQYSFVQKAFIAGSFVAISCSVLGLFLVLQRLSLIGHGLSHVSFGAVAVGLFLGLYPIYIAIPIVALSSLLILKLAKKGRMYGDSAIGIVSALGVSGGIILSSLSGGFNVDLFSYLFGNILAISSIEMYISMGLSLLVLLIVYLFYYELISVSFNEDYAKTTGVKTEFINSLLVVLTAIAVVLAIKIVGVMLVSSLLILPAVSALQLKTSFKNTLFFSSFFAVCSVALGIIISIILDIPAGATIILVGFVLFLISFLIRK
ncbi:metal ABC transporter permease [Patescibacteria group bacterium]|nr:metal ABC transporter permease [Patescibacteria group bacterium]